MKSLSGCLAIMWLFQALSPTPAGAQAKEGGLQPMDIFHIQYADDPRISPDGKSIVYVRTFSDVTTDEKYSNLWIINYDGSGDRPLTAGNHLDSSPRWSADGIRVLYASDADGSTQLYVRWMDSGQTTKITNL